MCSERESRTEAMEEVAARWVRLGKAMARELQKTEIKWVVTGDGIKCRRWREKEGIV